MDDIPSLFHGNSAFSRRYKWFTICLFSAPYRNDIIDTTSTTALIYSAQTKEYGAEHATKKKNPFVGGSTCIDGRPPMYDRN